MNRRTPTPPGESDEAKVALRRVLITGGPGAGKSALLAELARMGYPTVEESARAIIAERLAREESPRPGPLAFAQEILRRDIEKYHANTPGSGWVFFDRGALEAIAMVHEASPLPAAELEALRSRYRFHRMVFVLPPWREIYVNDSERDQSFADAVRVHEEIVRWYHACDYIVHGVPCLPVRERAEYVLRVLAQDEN